MTLDVGALTSIDMNLLIVFQCLFEELHVTRAASRMGISQPALSHALKRLRHTLGDELFVKRPKGMVSTERARELAPLIKDILERIDQAVLKGATWDLASAKRTFRIQSTDLVESLLLPGLIPLLQSEAKATSLAFTTARFLLPKEELENGNSDLAIAGFFGELPSGFYRLKVFTDTLQCAVRIKHPRLGQKSKITMVDFVREDHVMITPGGELSGRLDQVLGKSQVTRRILVGMSTFMASGGVLAETDCVLVGPSRMFSRFSSSIGLKTFSLPVDMPLIQIVQIWHERNHLDPHHRWLREKIRQILGG
jgi:DNA-binding transcriptional LysR family regulator